MIKPLGLIAPDGETRPAINIKVWAAIDGPDPDVMLEIEPYGRIPLTPDRAEELGAGLLAAAITARTTNGGTR